MPGLGGGGRGAQYSFLCPLRVPVFFECLGGQGEEVAGGMETLLLQTKEYPHDQHGHIHV